MSIVKIVTEKDWVCRRLANYLVENMQNVSYDPSSYDIVYYLPYLKFDHRLVRHKRTAVFMTHTYPGKHEANYYNIAKQADIIICMSEQHKHAIKNMIHRDAHLIHVPVDPIFKRKKFVVGWSGRNYNSNDRKRYDWVQRLRMEESSWLEVRSTEQAFDFDKLPEFYHNVDLTLVTSTFEAGPLCLIESLACGVPVLIGKTVGMAPEFVGKRGVFVFLYWILRFYALCIETIV